MLAGMPSATTRSNLVIRSKGSLPPREPQSRPVSPRSSATPPHSPRRTIPIPIKSRHSPNLQPSSLHHRHLTQPYQITKSRKMPDKPTIAVVNASGRQAASFIRVASAVGYHVRAQLRNLDSIVANEISSLPRVQCFVGELYTSVLPGPVTNGGGGYKHVNYSLIAELFRGADLAFINTTFWGDEVAIGCALADAAQRANVQHYIYSSMPNYNLVNPSWPSLPLWSAKMEIESYIRHINLPATFVYTGIYNNNFTSLPYPLFCMELQQDGSFVWQAPFNKDVKLPWLDAEHDVGPAVLTIFKDGIDKWRSQRIALAYEMLTPIEACEAFSRGVGRPCRYVQGPIEIKVPIPRGYKEQLKAITQLYSIGSVDGCKQPEYFGTKELERSCPKEAMLLWEGYRGLEEYAREVFPLEESNNGLTWMDEVQDGELVTQDREEDDASDDESDVLEMGRGRKQEEWLA